MIRHVLYLLLAWLMVFANTWASDAEHHLQPVSIRADAERVAVWPGVQVVATDDPSMTLEQALQRIERSTGNQAVTLHSPDQILGRGVYPYWARFSIHNPEQQEQDRLLVLESTTQADVRLFQQQDASRWSRVVSLAETGINSISGGTPYPVWSIRLQPHQTVDLMLRVEGPSLVRFPLFMQSHTSFHSSMTRFHLAVGIVIGSCLFIGVYVVSFRRYLNDASLVFFVAMLFSGTLAALWLTGFLAEMFPSLPERMLTAIGFASYAVLFGSGCLHARSYLDAKAWAPRFDKGLFLLGVFWLGLAPWFSIAFPIVSRLLLVWGGALVAVVLLAFAGLAVRKKVPLSKYIVAAWLFYWLVGMTFVTARATNDFRFWAPNTVSLIQAMVILVLFGIAMNQRLIRNRDALVAAHQALAFQQAHQAMLMRERGLLLAATNHDLRQPLMGVGLFSDLLKSAKTQTDRDEYAQKLDSALKEVDDVAVGIQQLSKIHEDAKPPVFETVKLDALLAPVIEEYRCRAPDKRITIRYVPTQLSIATHPPYLLRIVRNILANSVRYSHREGRILVGCRRGRRLSLVIRDNGPGFNQQGADVLFQPFQQFSAELPNQEGFGLGLYSVRTLADTLGIEVQLRSTPGQGSEFWIIFPAESPTKSQG